LPSICKALGSIPSTTKKKKKKKIGWGREIQLEEEVASRKSLGVRGWAFG
jgi:hypothetical protein